MTEGKTPGTSEGANHSQRIEALETGLNTLTESMQALTQVVFELKDRLPPRVPAPANPDPGTNGKSNAPSQVPPPVENQTLPRSSGPPASGPSMSDDIQQAFRDLYARVDA